MNRALSRLKLVTLAVLIGVCPPLAGTLAAQTGHTMQPMCQTGCGGGGSTYAVTVTADRSTQPVPPSSTDTASFTVFNAGSASDIYSITCGTTGNASSCTPDHSSQTLASGDSATIHVTFHMSSTVTGTVSLTATSTEADLDPPTSTASTSLVLETYGVSVTPDGTAIEVATSTSGNVKVFTVNNTGNNTATFTLSCTTSALLSCSSLSPVTVPGGGSTNVNATYSAGAIGSATLAVHASNTHGADSGYYAVTVARYGLAVTPVLPGSGVNAPHPRNYGATGLSERFVVTNTGSLSRAATFTCTGVHDITCSNPSGVTIPAGDSAIVNVSYSVGTDRSYQTGTLTLQATTTGATATGGYYIPIIEATPAAFSFLGYTLPPASSAPEKTYSFTVNVHNTGGTTGTPVLSCATVGQLTCQSIGTVPAIMAWDSAAVTVGYTTGGTGTFRYVIRLGDVPVDSVVQLVSVRGSEIITPTDPLNGGQNSTGDSLRAALSHPSGISTTSIHTYVDGVEATGKHVTSSSLAVGGLALTAGPHTWSTYGCATNGRCDSVSTTFTALGPPTTWSLDDSLPPPNGHGIEGLLGGLPLPPTSLRGCPVVQSAPEIRLTEPTSFLPQPGGLVFAASVGMNDTLTIATSTVDRSDTDPTTCDDYGFMEVDQFNWSYWTGSDRTDSLWAVYPYSDSGLLDVGPFALVESPSEPAWGDLGAARELAILTRHPGPFADQGAWGHEAGGFGHHLAPERRLGRLGRSRMRAPLLGAMLPDPGAIKPSTFQLKLNDTLIVTAGVSSHAGVTLQSLGRIGATVTLPSTLALLHQYHREAPTSDNGGWNELVATISDSTGHTSSVRARFVNMPPGDPAAIALTPLRRFDHLDMGDCAAFGAFQCGGVMLTQSVPGFVVRDRARDLHLVYRSGSQRQPLILPVQMSVKREQRAPDSLHVATIVGGVLGDSTRYAGKYGAITGAGAEHLWEEADEERIVGSTLPAPSTSASIRTVTTKATSFYNIAGVLTVRTDTVSQDVIQTFLTDTTSTRFGQGWQLAELDRLVLGQTFHGDTAAIWLSGDGSLAVYRRNAGAWIAPAGENSRLKTLSVTDGGAKYVMYLDNGAAIGFGTDGWQVWTADLAGNRTTFTYSNSRLTSIADPSGKQFRFYYESGQQVSRIAIQASGTTSDTTTIATLAYNTTGNSAKLTKFKLWRDSTTTGTPHADSTRYTYRNTTYGGLIDSIVDPRSASGAVIGTKFSYDTLYTPLGATGPTDRYGVTQALYRDVWRRAVPRDGYGRVVSGQNQALERLPYPNQVRGTMIDFAGHVTDVRVDRFGSPIWVSSIAAEANVGGFSVPSSAADDIRDIERDTTGRVTKIVRARNIPELTDSVTYQYDALGRVTSIVKPTARFPVPAPGAGAQTDTTTFTYDSISVVSGGAWCSRLKSMSDSVGSATVVQYGASGAAACLPIRTIGLASDTTIFTYGTLAAGNVAGVRPVKIRDPNGVIDSVAYDATTWNTSAHVRTGGAATRVFFNRLGRPDSIIDPMGVRTRLIANRLGWPLLSKAGRGDTVLTSRTSYLPGGLANLTELYVSSDANLNTPIGTIQPTTTWYNRLGQVDSMAGPGSRTATDSTRARKQSWVRDRGGNPLYSFGGNGSGIVKSYDWQGRISQLTTTQVWSGLSLDREPFAATTTRARYDSLPLTMGRNLSAGGIYQYTYDALGRVTATASRDAYFGLSSLQTSHTYGYTRRGALAGDTLTFDDGTAVRRAYEYNRRGQRTLSKDDVIRGVGDSIVGDSGATTRYYYNAIARLDSMVTTTHRPGAPDSIVASIRWLYDRGGRDTLRVARTGAGSVNVSTRFHYDALGRVDAIAATQPINGAQKTHYSFSSPTRDSVDNLRTYTEQRRTDILHYTNTFSGDGAGRLLASSAGAGKVSNSWTYDAFGNRVGESLTRGDGSCAGATTLGYGVDNRILVRHSGLCHTYARYLTDQAGNRLAETDSASAAIVGVRAAMSYTALNQLYFAATPTSSPGTWEFAWHWYDPQGLRVMSWIASGNSLVTPRPDSTWTIRNYYVYDASDVALTLVKSGSTWRIQQRYVTGGVDEPLATRVWTGDATLQESLILVPDRQGTSVTAIKGDGAEECRLGYTGSGAFGAVDATIAPCGNAINVAIGYTGASVPTGAGGYTYLRNRWYDPQTGRFLTQDPIGLAGGANLYAYAGNNPVSYTDPFGLCPDKHQANTLCFSFFIQAKTLFPGLKGDGRGFSSSSEPDQSRGYIVIDTKNQRVLSQGFSPSCTSGNSCSKKPSRLNQIGASFRDDGTISVSYEGHNSKTTVPGVAGYLEFKPNGAGSYKVDGFASRYPSLEAYYYDDKGAAHTVLQQKESSTPCVICSVERIRNEAKP